MPAVSAFAQAPGHEHDHAAGEQYRIDARRAPRAPAIDGALDEPMWRDAAMVDSFTQQEPVDGEPATERTEVRVLYDAGHLYIGVHAFDSQPAAVIATEMRRDSPQLLEEDNFQIILDTFRDSRSGYMFVTNPLGAKLEQQVFEEGGGNLRGAASNINRDWNGVWDAAAQRTADGWTAEIDIPMVTVRSPEVDVQTWGINFMRNIRRKNEVVYWSPIPKPYTLTRVSLAGSVSGMTGVTRGLDLRLKPFVIAGGRRDRTGRAVASSSLHDVGLDAKYGLSSGLTLDVTLNTDFAQAEVDEQQVNLTRFPLFFPEKRDFFLENSGQFTVGNQGNQRLADLFFSRRIGLSATGQPVPIMGGARMTGKMGRNNLAVMELQTGEAFGRPGENFLVARYSRDVGARSRIGGLVVNKDAVGSAAFNRTLAADTLIQPTPSVQLYSFLAQTATPGVTEDQQAFHTRVAFMNRKWNNYGEYTDIDEHFNAEAGFVPRTGIRKSTLHLERNPRPGGLIRVMEPMITIDYTTDQTGRLVERRIHHMVGTRFQNGTYLNVFINRWLDVLDEPFAIQRGVVIPAGVYRFHEWNFIFNSNPARRVYERFTYSPQTFYDGTRREVDLTLGLRASSRASAEFALQRNDVDIPWGAFVVNLGVLRLDYTISPRMSVRSLSQYNSLTRQTSASVRYNFVYKPGSDLYIVYDGLEGNLPGRPELRNHQLVVKMTYLLSR
ncbi:MAG: carbohydrate binding family 9 domain-containing protein [Acidobacteria bacterium]|nr:carbohydrate binding family 9 domain-containing protein [Acidobacteriota bacterium]